MQHEVQRKVVMQKLRAHAHSWFLSIIDQNEPLRKTKMMDQDKNDYEENMQDFSRISPIECDSQVNPKFKINVGS